MMRAAKTECCDDAGSTTHCVTRAPAVAIAIFQLVAGRSRDDDKMHYRSTRRRIIWMNVAQMNASNAALATHDNTSNDFCCSSRRHRRCRRCVEQLLLSLFVLLAATCTDFKPQDRLALVILYLLITLLEIFQISSIIFSLYAR